VALSALSRLENGKGGATFRTLEKIIEALGITMAELYRGLEAPAQDAVVITPGTKEAETFTYDAKASAILLATQLVGKTMLPQLVVLQPGGKTALEQHRKGTQRWLFGLEGTVDVQVGEKTYRITKGGAVYLDAAVPHRIRNAHALSARQARLPAGRQGSVAKVISVTSPVVW